MGRRMSGGLAWARVEPSTNSTIEWTTDCGWTTTSIAVEADPEQQVRLDDLQALVDQRRAVRRHQGAHRPRRVGEGLLGADVGERGPVAAAERPARGGEHEPAHLVGAPAAQALRERGVLGVDGDDLVGPGQRR